MGQCPEMLTVGKGGCWWDRRTLGMVTLLVRLRLPACIGDISCCGG